MVTLTMRPYGLCFPTCGPDSVSIAALLLPDALTSFPNMRSLYSAPSVFD